MLISILVAVSSFTPTVWELASDHITVHPHPGPALRVTGYVGDQEVSILVDTGADYSAVNKKWAEMQRNRGNNAFLARRDIKPLLCESFAGNINARSEAEQYMNLTLWGQDDCDEPIKTSLELGFLEFSKLNETIIIGMPDIDKGLPLVMDNDAIKWHNTWISRDDVWNERYELKKRKCLGARMRHRVKLDKDWRPV
jgi:hypothetical protein